MILKVTHCMVMLDISTAERNAYSCIISGLETVAGHDWSFMAKF